MNDDLAPLLKELAEPLPPSTITATVMARIARDVDQRVEAQVAAPVGRGAEIAAWLYTLTGVALVIGICFYGWWSTGSAPSLTAARIGVGGAPLMPALGNLTAVLGLGLLVYIAGLLAPLRRP